MPRERTAAPSFETWMASQGWKNAAGHALKLLAGAVPADWSDRPAEYARGMLRWAVSDEPDARVQWEVLSDRAQEDRGDLGRHRDRGRRRRGRRPRDGVLDLADRDAYVEALWRSLRTVEGLEGFRVWLRGWDLEPVYRRYLAGWCLARFDLRRALRVGCHGGGGRLGRPSAALLLDLSLPRLGAGVAVGYLALATASELVAHLTSRPTCVRLALTAGLLAVTWAYTALHVGRHLHPAPRPRTAAVRAATLLAFGAAWTALELAFFASLLLAPDFHAGHPLAGAIHRDPTSPALLATVALALGMALELAWEEKPLTDPL